MFLANHSEPRVELVFIYLLLSPWAGESTSHLRTHGMHPPVARGITRVIARHHRTVLPLADVTLPLLLDLL